MNTTTSTTKEKLPPKTWYEEMEGCPVKLKKRLKLKDALDYVAHGGRNRDMLVQSYGESFYTKEIRGFLILRKGKIEGLKEEGYKFIDDHQINKYDYDYYMYPKLDDWD